MRDERRRKTGDGQRRGERAGSRCGKGAGPRRREIGGWILRRRRIRPISPRVPGLMGVCGRRPPLAGGERAETYMVRSPCEGRATECAGARAFAGPQQESKCTNSASLRQNTTGLGTARKKSWKKSLPRGPRFTPEGAMALVGPSPCWWREAVGPLPKRGVRWNASGTARSRAVATGLSQQSWWHREGNVNSSTALRASSQDGHSARDEEFSARRDMDDIKKDADTASVRPPTPAPVFRRRPKPKRGRGRPRLPKPPPRHPRPDLSKTSPQASRQQNALFKGLARQMTGLSALGLPNSPELQRWRATVEEDHQARRPGRKPKGSAAAKRKQKPKPKTETRTEPKPK